jgi:hypothetical protein
MSGHTPGPWVVAKNNPDGVLDRSVMAGRYFVATVHDTASHNGCWDADAHLIAAAPELLDTLRKLANEVEAIGAFAVDVRELIGATNWNVLTLRLQEARAALLKASPSQSSSEERIADSDRLKIPRLTAAWGGIANAPEALDEAALKAAKEAMVEATGLSPMWGSAAAWAGARAAVTAYLAAISGDRP